MNDPTYLVQPPTASLQHPSLSSTTKATVHINNNINSKETALLVGSNNGGVGGDQDVDGNGGSANEIQATAKVSTAGLESVLKSALSSMDTTTATTMATVAGGEGSGDGRVEFPQIVQSVSLRNCVPHPVPQRSTIRAPVVAHAKKVQDLQKSQPLAPDQAQQPQVQQKQQVQTTTTSLVGGGYEYSPPREHIYYSHTSHNRTQHHHHRLHHHHYQHSSSTESTTGSSYSKVGAVLTPIPLPQQQQQQDTKSSGSGGETTTAGRGLNRTVGAADNNGSLGLLVDPTLKCCKVRSHHPQLTVATSPVPVPSQAFVSMPSTASSEIACGGDACLTPASVATVGSMKDGSAGGSDASTFDSSISSSSVSSSSSMTSVSLSSVTEYSNLTENDSKMPEGELRSSDNRRSEKEEGRKTLLTVDGGVTGSLTPQQHSSSFSSSQQYWAHDTTTSTGHQRQQQQQEDHVPQELQQQQQQNHPSEFHRQVLPPTSTDLNQHEEKQYLRPRVCKMLVKHPSVKLDWKVPEPIKAGGEVLRGVLIITAKELLEAEVKAAVKSKNSKKGEGGEGEKKKMRQDRFVWIEHIEIDLTGLEEVTTGAGLLSRTRTDRHCFLHKTQVLPIEDLKCILDTSSSSSSSSYYSASSLPSSSHSNTTITTTTLSQSGTASSCGPIPSRTSSLMHSSSSLAETDLAQPGRLLPGTQQGISFQMRIPERVGGIYRNAHASISYQLTANVHIRRGKEMFVLQQSLPLSLFELVQIRAATKIASPHDLNPSTSINRAMTATTTTSASSSFTSATSSSVSTSAEEGGGKRQAGVRFVIRKANSVLGTAVVKPYSLWGLGPATSLNSSSHHGQSHHGYHYRRQSHQRRGSFSVPQPSSTGGSSSLSVQVSSGVRSGMTRSYSDIGTLSSHSRVDAASGSGAGSLSGNNTITTTSLKKARFDSNEMLSAEDQYRSHQLKQQQQEFELQQQEGGRGSRPKLEGRKNSTDDLDEVGFGAHIDKSVAAAGENVTMDMFVVKSDMMKVVDIKVSLVETIQIFSLLDHDGVCAVVSPIAGRAHVFDNHQHSDAETEVSTGVRLKRKLVETHMIKIAKAYVPAQAEESHANNNHLKGYYEDYEDARTTKSLSMYKLGMRIPKTALTIQDRDLFKVDYMFVIKFFFKGRMGAFLELPIEIVSQYNHNRISTISGAISCVSNSVQIALPPVPILIKRHDSGTSSAAATTAVVETAVVEAKTRQDGGGDDGAVDGEPVVASAKHSPKDEKNSQTRDAEGEVASNSQSAEEIHDLTVARQDTKDVTPTESDLSSKATSANLKSTSQSADPSSQDTFSPIDRSSTITEEQFGRTIQHWDPSNKDSTVSMDDSAETQKSEEDGILASSRLSKADFTACANRQIGLTDARYNRLSSTGTMSSITTTTSVPVKDLKKSASKPASIIGAEGVPKIVIEGVKTSGSSTSTTTPATTTVISPALPILFDLTSAALPTPAPSTVSPPIPAPLVIPRSIGGNAPVPMLITPGVRSSSMGAETTATSLPVADTITYSNSFPRSAKDTELHLPKLLPLRQGTNTSIYSCSSREDDHHSETDGSKSTSGGLVAKIAKSLSSPLLRSRNGTNGGSNISPSGSQTNLAIVSPQNQQSSAFTLAATTLSALTLLSSVGQAAVSPEGKKVPQPARPLKSCIKKQQRSSSRPPGLNTRNLTVSGGGGQQSRSATPSQGQGQGRPYNATNTNRKRVTFAKGLTPVPSPTGSQVMPSEPIVSEPFKYKNQYLNTTSSASSSSSSSSSGAAENTMQPDPGLSTSVKTNPGIAAATAPITATARLMVAIPNHPHQQHQHQYQQAALATAAAAISAPLAATAHASAGTSKIPNSASLLRLYHPFDSHPSRLSPLEKKHPDVQIIQDLKSSPLRGPTVVSKDLSSKGDDAEDEEAEYEEEEEEEEGEEKEEYEEEEDEEDDDQETEDERIERRKQARIAWLAKYGDAFKQVYGAVPELPPL
ncbi:hypothetical protein BG015_008323 [Linnemannia schmuckeri]|uniref:Uncharacterized protein n=1 Tax=Linnemannia schmuckeri TaxID=64567 RepID=A0A9P5VEJ6_9FUNG|nr:hypothetical protein BG015_008323 [Linnemannia schmuckeri]